MKMHRFALRGLGFLVLWMLLHCGSELAAAVPPGQCCAHYSLAILLSYTSMHVTSFELPGDMQMAGTITPPTPT